MTELHISVRPYEPSDQAGIEWLYARTPPSGRTYPRPEPVPDDLRNPASSFEYVVVAVEADRDGEAVVGLTTVANASVPSGVPLAEGLNVDVATARLRHVLVAPERWRQGIGRCLVENALAWCRERGYREVILDTTSDQAAAVAFYHALGFRDAAHTRFRDRLVHPPARTGEPEGGLSGSPTLWDTGARRLDACLTQRPWMRCWKANGERTPFRLPC